MSKVGNSKILKWTLHPTPLSTPYTFLRESLVNFDYPFLFEKKTCNAYNHEDRSPRKFYCEGKRENKYPRKLEFQESAKSAKLNPREN